MRRRGLVGRSGVYYADGRAGGASRGRHSLGTRDREEALRNLHKLDRQIAEKQGLVEPEEKSANRKILSFARARKLYEDHIRRPRVAGGTSKRTQARYKAVSDKLEEFLKSRGTTTWNGITRSTLSDYATHLAEELERAPKTIRNELTTTKQADRWLCEEGHLDRKPLKYRLNQVESERGYCWSDLEVEAMLKHCRSTAELRWLHDVIFTLAYTGMRIGELENLKWSDVSFAEHWLVVADESGHHENAAEETRATKSRKTRRIPLRDDLANILKQIPRTDEYVFHGPRGGRLKPDTVRNLLKRDVIEPLASRFPARHPGTKSFTDGTPHSFRHFFAHGVPTARYLSESQWSGWATPTAPC